MLHIRNAEGSEHVQGFCMTESKVNPGRYDVQLLLCDFVSIAESKLFINGGGWTWIDPGVPFGIAALIQVPWTEANRHITFELRLLQADGEPVMQQGPAGMQPVAVAGEFEVGRPAGHTPGAPIAFPMAFNFGPLPLPPSSRLQWELLLDGFRVIDVAFDSRGTSTV